MHGGNFATGCSIFQRKIVHLVAVSRGANQNYSTYVTMIHRRYERLQHKCSPFLQVLHKRTKCLVYKRIENPGPFVKGFSIQRTKLVVDPCKDGRYSSSAL
mgnify:FL=1